MDKWYIGYITTEGVDSGTIQLFKTTKPTDATPETSGYDYVAGPFNTKKEALEFDDEAS